MSRIFRNLSRYTCFTYILVDKYYKYCGIITNYKVYIILLPNTIRLWVYV